MKILRLTAIACVLIFNIAKAQQSNTKTDTVFFEDFNENTLDRTKWNVEITGNTVNEEQQAYVDSASTLSLVKGAAADGAKNGALLIKAIYHPGYISNENKKYDFLSGRINTQHKMEFTYGTASARMKMTGGAGLWPAFWALGNGEWPDCGEIDIMETVGDPTWFSNALHGPKYFGNTPLTYRYFFPKGTDVSQWHVYSVDWSANSLVFKVDGIVTYSVTRAKVEHYGRYAFDNAKFIILNFALGGGYPNGVNRIKEPYFGISRSTVDIIKAGQAKVLVDWVLVTKKAN
ncbi:glycoside hydrolase family 16 protein [Mucilaginibacter gotjawali]|uniref:Glucan endo-1,3-beta-glucosidase A1 n=2 Tax=Mucilaginibacter gotjawali TaxID=1550579 RepID=A0A110B3W1_9SPHI|nr:glycoside hydrolase family 16 protein [Mucilaginibacter gotjawali]MBB3058661.1 beta-glucanase (GH16 family) [Mucilaginibacter gotjawali]BAU55870.1 Glucan endo-1,3-beta-glucosidase A1 precursor [Mucilaginibacter gotjawali]